MLNDSKTLTKSFSDYGKKRCKKYIFFHRFRDQLYIGVSLIENIKVIYSLLRKKLKNMLYFFNF
jgi:hypothetical protein